MRPKTTASPDASTAAQIAVWKAETLVNRFTRLPVELAASLDLTGATVESTSWDGTVLELDGYQTRSDGMRRDFTVYVYRDAAQSPTGKACWGAVGAWEIPTFMTTTEEQTNASD